MEHAAYCSTQRVFRLNARPGRAYARRCARSHTQQHQRSTQYAEHPAPSASGVPESVCDPTCWQRAPRAVGHARLTCPSEDKRSDALEAKRWIRPALLRPPCQLLSFCTVTPAAPPAAARSPNTTAATATATTTASAHPHAPPRPLPLPLPPRPPLSARRRQLRLHLHHHPHVASRRLPSRQQRSPRTSLPTTAAIASASAAGAGAGAGAAAFRCCCRCCCCCCCRRRANGPGRRPHPHSARPISPTRPRLSHLKTPAAHHHHHHHHHHHPCSPTAGPALLQCPSAPCRPCLIVCQMLHGCSPLYHVHSPPLFSPTVFASDTAP